MNPSRDTGGTGATLTATAVPGQDHDAPSNSAGAGGASPGRGPRYEGAFWLAAVAFALTMGLSAVPTPIYAFYERRDHFSSLTVTIVYAVYAIGVVTSLFLAGHMSDQLGRRKVLIPALLTSVASAVIFILWPSLPGLLVARVVCGVSVGLATATATAYLEELHRSSRPQAGSRRADLVVTVANLGGIGLGPLTAGLLVQYAPAPLRLSYLVFGGLIAFVAVGVAFAPETLRPPRPRPAYHPQRITVPADQRGRFFAASLAGMTAFAVFGVFNSLAPSFLAGTLHETSHAVAGAVAFAAFAGGAAAQVAQPRATNRVLLMRGIPVIVVGLGLMSTGMWLPSLGVFIVGGVLSGAGSGMVFKGSLLTAADTAPPESRAEVLAGFFIGAYIGLSIPVVGLGIATRYAQPREVMLVFVAAVTAAIVLSVRAVLRDRSTDNKTVPPEPST